MRRSSGRMPDSSISDRRAAQPEQLGDERYLIDVHCLHGQRDAPVLRQDYRLLDEPPQGCVSGTSKFQKRVKLVYIGEV